MVPTRTSPGHLTARPSKSFLQRTAGLLTGCINDCRSHSTHVFLNHAQMDPESVQVDFEWACNLEQPNGGFNSGESCLMVSDIRPIGACLRSDRVRVRGFPKPGVIARYDGRVATCRSEAQSQ